MPLLRLRFGYGIIRISEWCGDAAEIPDGRGADQYEKDQDTTASAGSAKAAAPVRAS